MGAASYAPIDAPPRRAGRVALVAVAAGLLVAGALYPKTAAPPLALATAAAKTTVALTYADFLAVDEVCKYVRQQEDEDCYDVAEATLLKYVPRRVELTVDRALVEGSVGAGVPWPRRFSSDSGWETNEKSSPSCLVGRRAGRRGLRGLQHRLDGRER